MAINLIDDYKCICGSGYTNPVALGKHYRDCAMLAADIYDEYARISKLVNEIRVTKKAWDDHKGPGYPSSYTLTSIYGSAAQFQALVTGQEAVRGNDGQWYLLPLKPQGWAGKYEPGRATGKVFEDEVEARERFAALAVGIIRVAAIEATGIVKHWPPTTPRATLRSVIADAQDWIAELRGEGNEQQTIIHVTKATKELA